MRDLFKAHHQTPTPENKLGSIKREHQYVACLFVLVGKDISNSLVFVVGEVSIHGNR
jgi:hypothetical protein